VERIKTTHDHTASQADLSVRESEYEYDIAFSFLDKDEGVAVEISKALKGRLSTFIYSERQAELAGADGELKFSEVFGKRARIVAILYRNGWGETRWTRIEKTAIQNRSLEEGYDFAVFVVLDSATPLPKWLPKNRIWYNFPKFGREGIAAGLENRLSELGHSPTPETPLDRSRRISKSEQSQREREKFLDSEDAVTPANTEALALLQKIKSIVEPISKDKQGLPIQIEEKHMAIILRLRSWVLHIEWHQQCSNSLYGSVLWVVLSEARMNYKTGPYPEYHRISETQYDFALNESNEFGWVKHDTKQPFHSSGQLAESVINLLIDKIEGKDGGMQAVFV
jgi:hypothetical protein